MKSTFLQLLSCGYLSQCLIMSQMVFFHQFEVSKPTKSKYQVGWQASQILRSTPLQDVNFQNKGGLEIYESWGTLWYGQIWILDQKIRKRVFLFFVNFQAFE